MGSARSSRTLYSLAIAAAAVAARLPYLLSHKIAFDSDEAVEGLMARHVLHGEFPAFFWGQAFKGVPEVYASAGAFAMFGSSVGVLKSVTLAFFAAFVALQFVLLDKTAGRWLAIAASLLLIACSPALVFWSLDASAEYVLIMLLGTSLLLLCLRYEERRSSTIALCIGGVVGVGLWVQPLFLVYALPVGLVAFLRTKWWAERGPSVLTRELVSSPDRSAAARLAIRVFLIVSVVLITLAIIAFLSGGFSLQLGGLPIGARAPQKLARLAVLAAAMALLMFAVTTRSTRRNLVAFERARTFGLGFILGYAPVMLYSVLVEPSHAPLRNANLQQLMTAAPDIATNIFPIIFGIKIATTERLAIPMAAVFPAIAVLVAYLWFERRRLIEIALLRAIDAPAIAGFFPLFVVMVPLLFLASGAYLDTQSYRYLIPWYAGLSVAWAAGSLALAGRNTRLASLFVAVILAVQVWQQVVWYRKLTPDVQSSAILDCLRQHGIRGGQAEYWTSYKLTFLSGEQIIIAPSDGIDRYPAYTSFVRSLPESTRITDATACR
jgi:hypothetical protein